MFSLRDHRWVTRLHEKVITSGRRDLPVSHTQKSLNLLKIYRTRKKWNILKFKQRKETILLKGIEMIEECQTESLFPDTNH